MENYLFCSNKIPIWAPLIMRKLCLLPFAACIVAFALPAIAQEAAKTPPPPQLETLDESEQPAITIRKPDTKNEISERREQGRVTEVKVKSGGSTYYLKPKVSAGSPPNDAHGSDISVPMWSVKEFDVGQNQESDKKPAPEAAPRLEPAKAN